MRDLLITVLLASALFKPLKGQNQELSFTPQLLCVDNNEACALGDVNRDGLMDIVAGRLWYAAPDFVPRPLRSIPLHLPEYAQNNGEYLLDMNNDDLLDLITTGWGDGRILWFENPGLDYLKKGMPWKEYTLVDTKIIKSEIGLLTDLNQDGNPEYLINSWFEDNPITIWQLTAQQDETLSAKEIVIGPRNGHGIGVGDINQDGRLDVLFDEGWYQQPDNIENNWTWHRDWKLNDSSCPMQVVDLNGDGRKDIIFGRGHDYGLYWMEQGNPVGDSTTWTKHVIDESWSQVHAMTWADLDGDGRGELITGKRVWAHTGEDPGANDPVVLYRYVWDSEKQSFQRFVINAGKAGTGLFIRVADLNQDNKQDIVVAGKTGTFILWQD